MKLIRTRSLLGVITLTLACVLSPDSRAEETLTGPALEIKKEMEALFEYSKKVNSEQAAEKREARAKIDGSMDWEHTARDCYGEVAWKKQSAKNREEFMKLLKDVIIRTAYTRLDKFWPGLTYKIDTVDIKGSQAHVTAKFMTKDETLVLEYYLQKKGSKWFIYDIAYEGERYSININQQIDAFLKENTFASLLEKLRKRREDLVRDEAKAKKSS